MTFFFLCTLLCVSLHTHTWPIAIAFFPPHSVCHYRDQCFFFGECHAKKLPFVYAFLCIFCAWALLSFALTDKKSSVYVPLKWAYELFVHFWKQFDLIVCLMLKFFFRFCLSHLPLYWLMCTSTLFKWCIFCHFIGIFIVFGILV